MEIQAILKEVMHFSRASIPSTIRMRNKIDMACRPVWADPTQMHRVFINLVANAFHAMEKNGGILTLSLEEVYISEDQHPMLPDGFYACVEVADTGTGIDSAILDKIFDPYFTTKGKDKGTGLGLSLVHAIVKSHDGHIEVKSTQGKGTHFMVHIPCTMENQEMEKTEHGDEFSLSDSHLKGNEHILVLDDEEAIARMLAHLLELLGYTVTMCTRSADALDLFMPGIDGFEVCQMIKEKKELRGIKVLAMTAFDKKEAEETMLKMGAEACISKSLDMESFIEKVMMVLLAPSRSGVRNNHG